MNHANGVFLILVGIIVFCYAVYELLKDYLYDDEFDAFAILFNTPYSKLAWVRGCILSAIFFIFFGAILFGTP